jgi:GMP synthase (glutamine-hydrolysing)
LLPEVLKMTEESEYLKQSSQLGNIDRPQVAILDFGSQYSHLIARRVREMHVYCELYSCLVTAEELGKHKLTAVILSGGPNSVYEEGAPHVAEGVWKLIEERNVPVLGICYGMQVGLYS